jgi:hypothetical protein
MFNKKTKQQISFLKSEIDSLKNEVFEPKDKQVNSYSIWNTWDSFYPFSTYKTLREQVKLQEKTIKELEKSLLFLEKYLGVKFEKKEIEGYKKSKKK